ncbi:hypothetical protein Nepgr_019120 [Nepenthes gracilis]|uniref:Uncharacterized protein n=1 Tax=Nepenthes gracilis TaxID=150966 RepID=A0AAD3XUP9_NEPGR|nr:hypothetical protein Nepgr_019120 [Nepenthes gracilis]
MDGQIVEAQNVLPSSIRGSTSETNREKGPLDFNGDLSSEGGRRAFSAQSGNHRHLLPINQIPTPYLKGKPIRLR